MYLKCHDIDFFYPGTEKAVLRNLSLCIDTPGFHAFFGPSGAGKTSLARLLTGDLQCSAGRVVMDGMQTLLYAYNLERLPGWSSVGSHLDRITPAGNHAMKDKLIEAFGMTGFIGQRFGQLSLGQQNRVNLLRYLVQDFDLLIMDESLANVDEKTRGRIITTVKVFFPNAVFIYISHNVIEVARYCRQIWVLRDADKSPQAIVVQGLDRRREDVTPSRDLQRVMLEIMNAA